MAKKAYDIDEMMRRIEEAVHPYPKAALFELAERGYGGVFEQLVACILSIRTRDEVMLPTALRLFERARTPAQVAELSTEEIDALIRTTSFHERKARQIRDIAHRVEKDYGGRVPCDAEALESFPGVGPKCSHLVLGIACGKARVSADVHVHRVTNRWGYVQTRAPERTMEALESKLPRRYWVEINRQLVPFGKHICTRTRPHCSTCPVLEYCRQVGVKEHR